MATLLFSPLCLRELAFKNRIFVSPMCQYSSIDGMPTDWHLVHLGSRAGGGAGLVMVEATAVVPEGRISPEDSGIWTDAHAAAFQRIAAFISARDSVPGIQIAHAGRKASTARPWQGGNPVKMDDGGWQPLAPSPIPFAENYTMPRELSPADIGALVERFADAAKRALTAGFKVIEIHMAHGYLLHSFCRRYPMFARMNSARISRAAPDSRWRSPKPSARSGRRPCRSLSASPQRTGLKADGILASPSGSAGACAISVSI